MSRISAISSTTPYLYGHISSGNRLMSAADGAAELAIVEKEKAQVTGYNTGTKNLSDGANMLHTSDSALGSITGHLQRMRELGLRASSSILNDSNRADIQKEIDQLKQGIEHIATQTRFTTHVGQLWFQEILMVQQSPVHTCTTPPHTHIYT